MLDNVRIQYMHNIAYTLRFEIHTANLRTNLLNQMREAKSNLFIMIDTYLKSPDEEIYEVDMHFGMDSTNAGKRVDLIIDYLKANFTFPDEIQVQYYENDDGEFITKSIPIPFADYKQTRLNLDEFKAVRAGIELKKQEEMRFKELAIAEKLSALTGIDLSVSIVQKQNPDSAIEVSCLSAADLRRVKSVLYYTAMAKGLDEAYHFESIKTVTKEQHPTISRILPSSGIDFLDLLTSLNDIVSSNTVNSSIGTPN